MRPEREFAEFRRRYRATRPLDLDEDLDYAFIESVAEFRRWFNANRPVIAALARRRRLPPYPSNLLPR
jgi:hypothetical protein